MGASPLGFQGSLFPSCSPAAHLPRAGLTGLQFYCVRSQSLLAGAAAGLLVMFIAPVSVISAICHWFYLLFHVFM